MITRVQKWGNSVEPAFALEDLLAQVTEDNLHGEIETGPAVGREVW